METTTINNCTIFYLEIERKSSAREDKIISEGKAKQGKEGFVASVSGQW